MKRFTINQYLLSCSTIICFGQIVMAQKAAIKIACIGDSVTAGYLLGNSILQVNKINKFTHAFLLADVKKTPLAPKSSEHAVALNFPEKTADSIVSLLVVDIKGKEVAAPSVEDPIYRTVFESGKEGYSIYRIPTIAVARSGKILAFTETRNDSKYDAAGNDIVIKTSTDNGESWGKLRVICSDKENALMNPTVTVDKTTGRIILFYVRYPAGLHEGLCAEGYEGDKVLRTYTIFSDDEGVSWSKPKDITVQVKAPETRTYAPGPGSGIQIKNGKYKNRLVIPFNTTDTWQNYIVYSDDGGTNWQRAEGRTGYGMNEVQIVELSDGSIMANARSHRWEGHKSRPENWNPWNWSLTTRQRGTSITKDFGKTWSHVKDEEKLIDPTCMGSIIRIDKPYGKLKSCLLFSNPANDILPTGPGRKIPQRVNGTVRISYDDGKSWEHSKNIYGDEKTHFGYSMLVHLKNGNIACLFESEGKIIFTSFSFSWLTDGK